MFLAHLDDLRGALRGNIKIHVIPDNAKFHKSEAVMIYLWNEPEQMTALPTARSPDCNPIERVWWRLHEEVTRNHQCRSMEELLDFTFGWLGSRNPFKVEASAYKLRRLIHFALFQGAI